MEFEATSNLQWGSELQDGLGEADGSLLTEVVWYKWAKAQESLGCRLPPRVL